MPGEELVYFTVQLHQLQSSEGKKPGRGVLCLFPSLTDERDF